MYLSTVESQDFRFSCILNIHPVTTAKDVAMCFLPMKMTFNDTVKDADGCTSDVQFEGNNLKFAAPLIYYIIIVLFFQLFYRNFAFIFIFLYLCCVWCSLCVRKHVHLQYMVY